MIYDLSLSRDYVSNWGTQEAIRELLQNAIDSNSNGHEMYIDYNSNKELLTIGNKYTSIGSEELILGNSSKRNDSSQIGCYGEGFKLALLVLLRNGYKIWINNCKKKWLPRFGYSECFNSEVLQIEETDYNGSHLEFEIEGITPYTFEELRKYFPCIDDSYGKTIKTANGYILLDPKFKGKMFVSGLYIQDDSSFEFGYNFNADEVDLDRDRKAINYYKLRELTAQAAITVEECNDRIYKNILKRSVDTLDIADVIDQMSDDFGKEFVRKFYAENELDDDTVVATPSVSKELERQGYKTFNSNESVSRIISKVNDTMSIIDEAKVKSRNRSRLEEAWGDFANGRSRQLLQLFYKVQSKLNKEEQDEFYELAMDLADDEIRYFSDIEDELKKNLPMALEDEWLDIKIG